eukprot:1921644-Rhodomonas_salina.1
MMMMMIDDDDDDDDELPNPSSQPNSHVTHLAATAARVCSATALARNQSPRRLPHCRLKCHVSSFSRLSRTRHDHDHVPHTNKASGAAARHRDAAVCAGRPDIKREVICAVRRHRRGTCVEMERGAAESVAARDGRGAARQRPHAAPARGTPRAPAHARRLSRE